MSEVHLRLAVTMETSTDLLLNGYQINCVFKRLKFTDGYNASFNVHKIVDMKHINMINMI